MKFNKYSRIDLDRAKRIAGMLLGLLNNSVLPQNTKLLLYKVAIRSVLIYAFPIWFSTTYTKRYSDKLIYEQSGVIPFCRYAQSLMRKFVDNLEHHDNTLMNEIFEYEKHLEWASFPYLSPVGILTEPIEDVPDPFLLPNFYIGANLIKHLVILFILYTYS